MIILNEPSAMGANWDAVIDAIFDPTTGALPMLAGKITGNPILLLPVGLGFAFGAVALAKKLIGIRRR